MSVSMRTAEAAPALLGEICSETAPLRAALVHRPGRELDGLDDASARAQLFDGALWPERARQEHDELVASLVAHDVRVFHLGELLAGVLALPEGRAKAVEEALSALGVASAAARARARGWLEELPAAELARVLVEGEQGLCLAPLASQMFVRDSSAWVGREPILAAPARAVRRRERLQLRLVYDFHPLFAGTHAGGRDSCLRGAPFEGGDLLVLSGRAVAIGIGQRTSAQAARRLAQRLFAAGFEEALAVELPRARFAIHLDCLLTVVDLDAVLFDRRLTELRAWRLRPVPGAGVSVGEVESPLSGLARALGQDPLREIEVADAGEQWSHAANALALAPGTVVAFEQNRVTNRRLRAAGIEVVETPGHELGRGRGGPRCLTCPLARAPLGET